MYSRGQYGEEIIKPVFSRLREIRVLSQEDKFAVLNSLSTRKVRNESFFSVRSECLLASAVLYVVQVVCGGHQKGFIDFVPPAFVNSQIAQVDGPTVFEEMIFGSSLLCGGVFVTSLFFFFLLKIDDLENSFQYEISKKIPDNISGFECEVPVKEPEKNEQT